MTKTSLSTDTTPEFSAMEHDLGEMDLVKAAARGSEMELRHPSSGKFIGIFITLCGADSKTYQEAYRRISDLAQKDGRKNVDLSVYQRRASEIAAAVTLGWSYDKVVGMDTIDGVPTPRRERREGMIPWHKEELSYSDENAVNVYLERSWIREQIEGYIQVRENFFPG